MARMDTRSVLIVGAGIAGLAVARALRRRGFEPEIVERARAFDAMGMGTGIYMPGNGVRAMETLGLADQLLARAVWMSHQRMLDHAGRVLAQVQLNRVWDGVGQCIGVRRSALHELLRDGAAGVPIQFGKTVSVVTQTLDAVRVTFDDGATREFAIVIGADGIRSSIRRLVFGDIAPRYVGQVCWRFLVKGVNGPQRVTTWTVMLAPDRAFLMLPVGDGDLYVYADLVRRELDDPTGRDVAKLRELFADFAEPAPTLLRRLASADAVHFAPIEEVNTDPWVKGRVVLIGDAAHATSPNMAEGAAMALEDAIVLSEVLEQLGRHPDSMSNDLLSAFAQRRRARVEWVQQRTHRRDRIRALPVFLRNLALRAAGPAIYRKDYKPLFEQP
jgi:FAD-dependent urate hydroxylase